MDNEEENVSLWDQAGWTLDPFDCAAIIKMTIAGQDGLHEEELNQVAFPLAEITDPEFARQTMDKIKTLSGSMGWENLFALAVGTATILLGREQRAQLLQDGVMVAVGDGELGDREFAMIHHLAESWGIKIDDLFGPNFGVRPTPPLQ